MRTVLTVGREPDNDLVINLPIVSGHHARVTWGGVAGQAVIEDLGSSNGTAIGQVDRKITRATLSASDTVYFGNHPVLGSELLGWVDPSLAPVLLLQGAEMVVGRDPGCHRVVDRSSVSGRHARLKRAGERILLEDLGSSNGTFLNGRRVEGPTEVRVGDLIGLGADSFRLATGPAVAARPQRVEAIKPPLSPKAAPTTQVPSYATAPPDLPSLSGMAPAWVYPVVLVASIIQAPVLAAAIGLLSGSTATALFALSLAALWFGLSTAAFGLLFDPKRPEGSPTPDDSNFWLSRWLILGALCVGDCVLAQVIAFPVGGLKGSGLSVLGLLILASGVGLTVGSLLVLLSPRPPVVWAGVALVVVALGLFGGGPWSLPRSAGVIRMASNAAPSRWAFEGLLVTESDVRPTPEPTDEGQVRDLAEDYFPAGSDRMGARADAMALASMLIGLVGVGVFLVRFSGAGR